MKRLVSLAPLLCVFLCGAVPSDEIVNLKGAVQVPIERFTIPTDKLGVPGINLVSESLAVAGQAIISPVGPALFDMEEIRDFDLVVYLGHPPEDFRDGAMIFVTSLMARLNRLHRDSGLTIRLEKAEDMDVGAVDVLLNFNNSKTGQTLGVQMWIRTPRLAQMPLLNESGQPTGGFNPLMPCYALKDNQDSISFFETFAREVYPEEELVKSLLDWYNGLTSAPSEKWRHLAMAAFVSGDLQRARALMTGSEDLYGASQDLKYPPDFIARVREIRTSQANPEDP